MSTTHPYPLVRGIDTYTRGGAAVEIIEIDDNPECPKALIRQHKGCLIYRDDQWIDASRLYWVELWELIEENIATPPRAEFINSFR